MFYIIDELKGNTTGHELHVADGWGPLTENTIISWAHDLGYVSIP